MPAFIFNRHEVKIENIEFFILLGSTLIAIILGIVGIQRFFQRQKIERLKEIHKIEIKKKNLGYKNESDEKPLIQEEKVVYVKYMYIRKDSEAPVYRKYITRLDEIIDVHSEFRYYRLNKYNTKNNIITIRDRSSGIVDMNIVYPWKDLIFTDLPSKKMKNIITQDVSGSDTYFTVT